MPCPDRDVAVEAQAGLVADPDDPRLTALAPDRDLPLPQVNITALRILGVIDDPGQLQQTDPVARNTAMTARSRRWQTTGPHKPSPAWIGLRW